MAKNIFYAKKDCKACLGTGEFKSYSTQYGDIIYSHPLECDCWMADAIESGHSSDIDDGNYEVHPCKEVDDENG